MGAMPPACVLVSALALRCRVLHDRRVHLPVLLEADGARARAARVPNDRPGCPNGLSFPQMSQLRRLPSGRPSLPFGDGARLRCGLAQLAAEIFDGGYLVQAPCLKAA